ncbi:hypothetical protein G9A89_010332 [Geosiphon pyriformis]|nr:hypothetical protein G9A89_010332 [Geosiphon pyriformis]
MAILSKPTTGSSLNPLAFAGFFRPSPFLDHLVRFLSSVGGTDKVFMFIQYYSKIVTWFLLRSGKTTVAKRITNLASPVADFRVLLRYYGLINLIQWMIYIEHNPPPSRLLLNIARVQNFLNLLYYPLEHAWWLGAHNVVPLSTNTMNKIGIWSCRFWAGYVILQFLHLYEQWRLTKKRKTDISKKLDANEEEARHEERALSVDGERIVRDAIINVGYLPLTLHCLLPVNWDLESNLINGLTFRKPFNFAKILSKRYLLFFDLRRVLI